MEHIPISKFKAHCTAIVAQVVATGQGVVITRHGKPVAELLPPTPPKPKGSWIGSMEGTLGNYGDIVNTSDLWDESESTREWEELNREAEERLAKRRKRP